MKKLKIIQSQNKGLVPIVIVGVLLIVLVLSMVLIFGNGAKKVVKDFAKAIEKQDATKMCRLINQDMLEAENATDACEEFFDESDFEIKDIEIGDSKEIDEDDLDDIKDILEDEYDIDSDSIKKVVRFKVSLRIYDGESERIKQFVWVANIKGKWSIIGITNTSEKVYTNEFNIF